MENRGRIGIHVLSGKIKCTHSTSARYRRVTERGFSSITVPAKYRDAARTYLVAALSALASLVYYLGFRQNE